MVAFDRVLCENQDNKEESWFNPHPFRSLGRVVFWYVFLHTLVLIVPLIAMPDRIEAVVAWLYYLLCGVLAIPSFAAFVICNSTKPPLGGEIFVWTVYILLVLGAVLPANKIWRRCADCPTRMA